MRDEIVEFAGRRAKTFGRRKITPRACVADGKRHLRAFLAEVLEDLGFVTCECASADELKTVLAGGFPDLILFGVAADGIEPGTFLETLVREAFDGKVLAVGARESIIVKAVQQVGEEYGLAMLPPLTTPFAAETLRDRIAMLLPDEPAPINLRAVREIADRHAIRQALARTENNISGAAKLLGVSRPTLYDLLKQYRLQA